jgi:hypothetical protein
MELLGTSTLEGGDGYIARKRITRKSEHLQEDVASTVLRRKGTAMRR